MTTDERIEAVIRDRWRVKFEADGDTRNWIVWRIVRGKYGEFIRIGHGETLHAAWEMARSEMKPGDKVIDPIK